MFYFLVCEFFCSFLVRVNKNTNGFEREKSLEGYLHSLSVWPCSTFAREIV